MRAWLEQPHGRRHKAPPPPCALTTTRTGGDRPHDQPRPTDLLRDSQTTVCDHTSAPAVDQRTRDRRRTPDRALCRLTRTAETATGQPAVSATTRACPPLLQQTRPHYPPPRPRAAASAAARGSAMALARSSSHMHLFWDDFLLPRAPHGSRQTAPAIAREASIS